MQRTVLIRKLEEKEIFATPGALDALEHEEDVFVEAVLKTDVPLITEGDLLAFKSEYLKKTEQAAEIKRSFDFKPIAREHSPDIEILSKEAPACAGDVENFVEYFRDRLEKIRKVIRARPGGAGTSTIGTLKGFVSGRPARIIGMVNEKRKTKKGNYLVEIEDETGSINVIISQNSEAFFIAEKIMLDEVVGFDGKSTDNALFLADEILFPDLPIREIRKTEDDMAIAFISDVHVGSKLFMRNRFERMISWLRGTDHAHERERGLAGKIKYIVFAGDVVDGIGVYPTQEKELEEKDIYGQYASFDELIQRIPDYIEVVVAPGNHDAVRRAEPQPALPKEFFSTGRARLVTNPCHLRIEGLDTLMYHGTSMDSVIAANAGLSYDKPEKAMIELLKRRILSPIYGDNPIIPTKEECLAMVDPPDILHMGHIHKNGHAMYSGTVVINSGTWQDRTDFQITQGHMPTPCLLPVYETKFGRLSIINFKDA